MGGRGAVGKRPGRRAGQYTALTSGPTPRTARRASCAPPLLGPQAREDAAVRGVLHVGGAVRLARGRLGLVLRQRRFLVEALLDRPRRPTPRAGLATAAGPCGTRRAAPGQVGERRRPRPAEQGHVAVGQVHGDPDRVVVAGQAVGPPGPDRTWPARPVSGSPTAKPPARRSGGGRRGVPGLPSRRGAGLAGAGERQDQVVPLRLLRHRQRRAGGARDVLGLLRRAGYAQDRAGQGHDLFAAGACGRGPGRRPRSGSSSTTGSAAGVSLGLGDVAARSGCHRGWPVSLRSGELVVDGRVVLLVADRHRGQGHRGRDDGGERRYRPPRTWAAPPRPWAPVVLPDQG